MPLGGRGPLALYVHVPFCTAKCPYCAFPSAPPERGDEERYLAGLEREARFWASRLGPRPLSSLYVGGGDPHEAFPARVGPAGSLPGGDLPVSGHHGDHPGGEPGEPEGGSIWRRGGTGGPSG